MSIIQTATADLSNSSAIITIPDNNDSVNVRKVFSKIEVTVESGDALSSSVVKFYDTEVKDFVKLELKYKANILASAPTLNELLDGVLSSFEILLNQNKRYGRSGKDWIDFETGDPKIDQYPCRQVGLYDLYSVSVVTSIKYIESENKVIPSEYTLETFVFDKYWFDNLKNNGYDYEKSMRPIFKEKERVHTTKYTNNLVMTIKGPQQLYKQDKETVIKRLNKDGSYGPKIITGRETKYYDMDLNVVKTIKDGCYDSVIDLCETDIDEIQHLVVKTSRTQNDHDHIHKLNVVETHESSDPESRVIKTTRSTHTCFSDGSSSHLYSETEYKYSDVRTIELENGSITYNITGRIYKDTNMRIPFPAKPKLVGGSSSRRIKISILSGPYEGSEIFTLEEPESWLSEGEGEPDQRYWLQSANPQHRTGTINLFMKLTDGYTKFISQRTISDMVPSSPTTLVADSLNCWSPYGNFNGFIKTMDEKLSEMFTDDVFYSVIDDLVKAVICKSEENWKRRQESEDMPNWLIEPYTYEEYHGERDGLFVRESRSHASFTAADFKKISIPTTKFKESK